MTTNQKIAETLRQIADAVEKHSDTDKASVTFHALELYGGDDGQDVCIVKTSKGKLILYYKK